MRIEISTSHRGRLAAWHLRRILKSIDTKDLEGLDRIRLLESEPNDPEARTQPPYLLGFLHNGKYVGRKRNRGASIVLFTRDLFFPIPSMFLFSSVARLRVASILVHELGHHVIELRGYNTSTPTPRSFPKWAPVDPEQEAIADGYASTVLNCMFDTTYYRAAHVLGRAISYYMFELGNWWASRRNFRRAARLQFKAYLLDKENTDAWQSYLLGRRALLKISGSLTEEEIRGMRRRPLPSDKSPIAPDFDKWITSQKGTAQI